MGFFRFLFKKSNFSHGNIRYFLNRGRRWRDNDTHDIHVDLKEYVDDYAWRKFLKDSGYPRRLFMRRKNYLLDVSWSHLEFKDYTETEACGDTFAKIDNVEKENQECDRKNEGINKEQYLTQYMNLTGMEQIYEFKHSAQKHLKSSLELQSKYTLGMETNLRLDITTIAGISGSLSAMFGVTETAVKEFSEVTGFDIATKVKVPPCNSSVATLRITEKEEKFRIKVTTTVRPYDHYNGLPVTVKRKKNNKTVHVVRIVNLHQLFRNDGFQHWKDIVQCDTVKQIYENEIVFVNILKLITRGLCTVKAPQTEKIQVRHEKIELS